MVVATPVSTAMWRQRGGRAVLWLSIGALTVDALRAATTVHMGYLNYALVWGAIYLLGHAWYEGAFEDGRRAFMLAALGAAGLIAMTIAGPYHVSMVGVPGVEFGNTAPPSAALLALGFAQAGVALSLQRVMRRFLSRPAAWTATVLINGSIMTVYVWHMTAMALTIAVLKLVDSPVLAVAPSAGVAWWVSRPMWIGILVLATVPFLATLRGLESAARVVRRSDVSAATALAAAGGACISFGSVAFFGMTSAHPVAAFLAVAPIVPLARWLTRRDLGAGNLKELPSR